MGFYEERIRRMKAEMQKANFDALVLFKPQNSYYVSYYNPIFYSRPVPVVVPSDGEPTVIVPRLRDQHAHDKSRVRDIRIYYTLRISEALPRGMKSDPIEVIKDVLDERGIVKGNIGIDMDFIPVATLEKLRKMLPNANYVDASNTLQKLRMIKDQEEVEAIRKACDITEKGMEKAAQAIGERKTEQQIAVVAENAMKKYWIKKHPDVEIADFGSHEGGIINALWCFVLSGEKTQTRCPTARKIQTGDAVVTIILTTANCYHGENERTMIVGKPTSKQQKIFEAVIGAQKAALEAIRPGATCAGVNEAVVKIFEKAGFVKYLKARSGHSIGLGGHESPSLAVGEGTVLQPNMVFSVEPGVHTEYGSFRHSNTVLVTADGCEVLTKYPYDFLTVR